MFSHLVLLFQRVLKKPLLFGSILVVGGSMAGNFFQFLFSIFMTRNLTVIDYGILASLMSLVMIPALVSSAIFPTMVSFAATYYAKDQLEKVKGLFLSLGKLAFLMGVVSLIIFIAFSKEIGSFFQVNDSIFVILAGINVFIGFMMIVNSALLQAKLDFAFVSFISFFSSVLKFVFGAFFVLLGLGVSGAMLGMIVATTGGYLVSFFPLRHLFFKRADSEVIDMRPLLQFGAPAALIFFSLTSFITLDIVLVKHFFTPETAGLYAGLSLVGKVIFFVSAPISVVILPLLTQEHTKSKNISKDILLSFMLVLIPSVLITVFYTAFSNQTINFFLKNDQYQEISSYLPLFSLFIMFYSLIYILSNIFLSLKRTEIFFPLSLSAVIQILLISIFHDSILQVILINLGVVSILLSVLLLYYWTVVRKKVFENEKKKS